MSIKLKVQFNLISGKLIRVKLVQGVFITKFIYGSL